MSSSADNMQEIGLLLDMKASEYQEAGFPELAEKVAAASRIALDCAFAEIDPFDIAAATVQAERIAQWLRDFDARLS